MANHLPFLTILKTHQIKYPFVFIFAIFPFFSLSAQDVIRVQFIHGSKPKKEYRHTEKKWFGGIMGGHAGIELNTNEFLSFEGNDRFHPIDHSKKRHCCYRLLNAKDFWSIMGTSGDSVRKTTIIIPVNSSQKMMLDSLAETYVLHAPYDYSVFGMRCASATYEILDQLGIVKPHSYHYTALRIFYPKILRKKLLKQATKNGWVVERTEGSDKRKWEKD
jgi:hypothetical protein